VHVAFWVPVLVGGVGPPQHIDFKRNIRSTTTKSYSNTPNLMLERRITKGYRDRWAANDFITLSGALAYLDASFDRFDGAPCAVDGSTPPSSGPVGCDATGSSTPYAPIWSGYLAMDVVAPLSANLQFLGGLSIAYSDDFLTDSSLAKFLIQPSYSKIDARIGVAQADGRWELMLIGNNLTDELILNAGYLKAPRRITVQGTYRFGR
jgi:hypothetical protein